jgi:ADP-heptose:LPS heptosyltransferase
VTLLAPAASGRAVVGNGPAEARRLLDWERADVAAFAAEGVSLSDALHGDLAGHAVALAFTRAPALVKNLRAAVPLVIERDPHPPAGRHAARWLAEALEPLGLDPAAAPPVSLPSADEERQARVWQDRLPDGFLALHPGSGSARKNWPAARFLAVVERLRPSEPWLVVGGPADRTAVEPFRSRAGALVACDLPLRVLGALLARARVFVGNDSGVAHLASAWGAPTVALFGPTDPLAWAPDGPRVRAVRSRTGDVDGIAVDEVVAAVQALT